VNFALDRAQEFYFSGSVWLAICNISQSVGRHLFLNGSRNRGVQKRAGAITFP